MSDAHEHRIGKTMAFFYLLNELFRTIVWLWTKRGCHSSATCLWKLTDFHLKYAPDVLLGPFWKSHALGCTDSLRERATSKHVLVDHHHETWLPWVGNLGCTEKSACLSDVWLKILLIFSKYFFPNFLDEHFVRCRASHVWAQAFCYVARCLISLLWLMKHVG